MSSAQDNDSQERFALGFLAALILLVVGTVVGVVVYQRGIPHEAPPMAAPAAVEAAAEVATVKVEDGVVKFYFASNSADLAEGAQQALADVLQGLAAGRKVAVAGFHDATGDAEHNAELAKQRAMAVRDMQKAMGAAEEAIELRKPEVSTGSGDDAQARRVEVIVLPH
jgi:outer membrane protein OmpA-like peptidoglycan-associated protein